MEISSFSSSPVPPSKPGAAPARNRESVAARGAAEASVATTSLTLGAYEPIQQAMNNCPDSRAEVIARGKALAADPHYPSAEVAGSLARLFVADVQSALTAK